MIVLPCSRCGHAAHLDATCFDGEWVYRARCGGHCYTRYHSDCSASVALAKWNAGNGADDASAVALFDGVTL